LVTLVGKGRAQIFKGNRQVCLAIQRPIEGNALLAVALRGG
jgi:hypothetical protein